VRNVEISERIERLKNEKASLFTDFSTLLLFMHTSNFVSQVERKEQRSLMRDQSEGMLQYYNALSKRIELLEGEAQ